VEKPAAVRGGSPEPNDEKIRCEADHAPSDAATGADWSPIRKFLKAFIAQRPNKKRLKAVADFQPLPLAESFRQKKIGSICIWVNKHGTVLLQ
jgi:hypothetical protein